MADEITLDGLIGQVHDLAARVTEVPPCMRMPAQEVSCIRIEQDRPLESSEMKNGETIRSFAAYNANKLCSSCAAYWHLSMAEIELRHVKKMEKIR